ncbi:endonuclease domain-containing 1 protein-like [Mugil cephalus]|uniref:endonuclease domain-containing 1 protein-like n=1 Tax=Mugil cephalus TaxID=48193 RepID=UPI001FB76990|nr:endonuclease domain-containing 1 protein-like [Mugil cephalus]
MKPKCSTMTLLPLAVLLLANIPIETKVVRSMADCADFFLEQTPPNVPGILEGGNILDHNRYKPICQTFKNNRIFVTLYDAHNKIPVFSAAKYRGNNGKRPTTKWKIEPQLENIHGGDNMSPAKNDITYKYQAGNTDYKNNQSFDRGHLFPSSYGFTEDDRKSTFTLTNIVPQKHQFNAGSWNKMEQCIKCVLDKYCISNNNKTEGFVVIGAQPSNNNILNNKINIPDMLWSAFCCYSSTQGRWLASAHWGENTESDNTYLQTKTLEELHMELGGQFEVFPGTQCPLSTTVTEFYPNIDQGLGQKTCHCSPLTLSSSASPTTTFTDLVLYLCLVLSHLILRPPYSLS